MKTEKDNQELVSIPHDMTAEKMLLGSLILKPELTGDYVGLLQPEEFFYTAHRLIFRAIVEIFQEKDWDILVLSDKLTQKEELASVGGLAYLSSLVDSDLFIYNPGNCAKKIKETALRRKTMRANELVLSMVSDPATDWSDVLKELNRTVETATEVNAEEVLPKLVDLAYSRLNYVEELSKRGGELIGVTTGYRVLDKLTLGLQPANLIVLAARPGCGKSALALNISTNAAAKGKSIAFFSLEMSANELTDRLLCSIARVDLHAYKSGYLHKEEWQRLSVALSEIHHYKITIDAGSALTPSVLRSRVLKIKKQMGLDLIVVDYLQLMQSDTKKEKRYEEVAQISHSLKALSKDLNVPILALAQINRESEKRGDGKPKISDLRESGDIEQDSDMIWLLHNPSSDPNSEEQYPTVSLLIDKHRNGPTGKIDFVFLKEFTRFELKEN